MFFPMLALRQEGDEVLYPDPGFPMYESMTRFAGATPVPVPLREEQRVPLRPGRAPWTVTDRTRLIILNSPHNPCGSVAHPPRTRGARRGPALEHDLYVLSDEVYWATLYGGDHASISMLDGMADRTILLDGWSKTFAMTGWRLGFAAFPAGLVEPVTRLSSTRCPAPSAFSQRAILPP